MSDIDTELVDSLKALDPERPIREADFLSGFASRPLLGLKQTSPTVQPMPFYEYTA